MAADRTTRQRRAGLLQQTNFATARAAADAFETVNWNAGSVKVNRNVVINDFDVTSTSGLMPKQSRAYTDAVSTLKSIGFAGPALRSTLALYFAAALQKVESEGALTPFQKVLSPAFDSSIVDFSTSGYLFGVATDNITGTDGEILDSAVLNSFTFSIDFNAEGIAKLAQISGEWIGNNIQTGLNLSGVWVAEALSNFFNDTSGFTLNTTGFTSLTDYCKKKYTLTINNKVTSDCRSNSKPNNYKFSPEIITTVTFPYDSSTVALLSAYSSGTTGSVTLSTGSTGVAGFLEIISYGRISADPRGTDGAYEAIDLTIKNEVNTSATKSLQVTIADGVDRTW